MSLVSPLPTFFVLSTLCVLFSSAAPAADVVSSIPGWGGPLPSPQYSGFLSSNMGKQIHYSFVLSERNPATDPVVIWLNGGPLCSSIIGFYLENGPLQMNGDGTLSLNSGRWSISYNVLFLESPVGVGYSYWPGQPLPYASNDTSTASDNVEALVSFYNKFPEYNQNPLYISGESYAGVYVPMFAQAILASSYASTIPLKGILVGNGAIATSPVYEATLVQQRMEHAFHHGLFSPSLKAQIDNACNPDWVNRTDTCNNFLQQYSNEMGPLNAYNIEITCGDGTVDQHKYRTGEVGMNDPLQIRGIPTTSGDPCSAADDQVTAYVNSTDYQTAYHVETAAAVIGSWGECASGSTATYYRIPQNETETVYPGLLQKIAVLIYNGDQDECIPYIQDQLWTANMGYPVKSDWHPWIVDNQVAGYVTEFYAPIRFAFVTVKRAGHEVPMYQPERAIAMVQRFIANQPF